MSQGTGVDMEEDDLDTTWIKWFCAIPGNEFFCEVDKAFIEDSFNLFGIKQIFPHDYGFALATILDRAECMFCGRRKFHNVSSFGSCIYFC